MHTKTHAHAWHRPHAEALIPRPTIYAQICIHTHIHTCINAQMYKHIHTCIYIHISCPHTYSHTHIYKHAYKMYIWTHSKHVWNDGTAATAREAQLNAMKLYPSPCPLQSRGGYPSWSAAQSPVHKERRISSEQPQPTAARQRAVQTTSAYLHWCGADPPNSLSTPAPSLAVAPRNEVIFLPFWRGFLAVGMRLFLAKFLLQLLLACELLI